jgi:hypothetical protein
MLSNDSDGLDLCESHVQRRDSSSIDGDEASRRSSLRRRRRKDFTAMYGVDDQDDA